MAEEPLTPQQTQTPIPPAPLPRISTIRTFKADLDAAVKGENISMASVAIREAERRRSAGGTLETPEDANRGRKIVIASIVLIALGLTVLGVTFLASQTNPDTTVNVLARIPLVFADTDSKFDTTTARTSDIITFAQRKLRTIDRKIGSIEEIVLTKQRARLGETGEVMIEEPLIAQEFVRSLGTAAPDGFIRSLNSDYMYGIHAWQENHGFFLFTTNSYEKTFEELLSWEKRFMARDILPLLEETTTREGRSEKPWKDAIIRNIDTRVLRDDAGKPILIYGFLNNRNLLIAGSQETFTEVLSRFTTPRPVVR